MDSRWRFLHRLCDEAVTQKDSACRVMVNPVAKRGWALVKYGVRKAERKRDRSQVGKRASSRWREKLLGDQYERFVAKFKNISKDLVGATIRRPRAAIGRPYILRM